MYKSLKDKPFSSYHYHFETVIDRPVEQVWPHALRIHEWMNDHKLEPLSGDVGEAGRFERVFSAGVPAGTTLAPHHYYGIAYVKPPALITLEVFPEAGGSYGDSNPWVGLDYILLSPAGDSTRVTLILSKVGPQVSPVAHEEHAPPAEQDANKQISRYFDNLRRLAGGDSSASAAR